MKRISPEKFLFEKYVGRLGYSPNEVATHKGTPKPGVKFLGYCEARRLLVRPRTEGFAVMAEMENGDVTWLHVDQLPGVTEKLTKPPAPSTKMKDSYTKEEFNEAYSVFRMNKMGLKTEMENFDGIMRAWRGLLHVYINTEDKSKGMELSMQALQYEFGIRMRYVHGEAWMIKQVFENNS